MHIASIVKVVADYEIPANDFELLGNRVHPRYNRMLGLYDEKAVEIGVQLKEMYSANLSIISYCNVKDIPILRKALAMGADDLYVVSGESEDPNNIAKNLKIAIDKIGNVDLILAGRQSSDMDRGIVPGLLAGILNIPFIPQVNKILIQNGLRVVSQLTETGRNDISFEGPAVLSITDDVGNTPRIPTVKGIFTAKKKKVNELSEIAVNEMELEEVCVEIPEMKSLCEFLPVEDLHKTADILWEKLREEKYI